MNSILLYILKINIALAIFYLFYKFFLKKESSFISNRIYLLFTTLVSFIIPFVTFSKLTSDILIESDLTTLVFYNLSSGVSNKAPMYFNDFKLLQLIYLVGVLVLSMSFILKLLKLLWIILRGEKKKKGNYTLIFTDSPYPVFSFFRFLVLSKGNREEDERIIDHELTHIKQFHTFDVIFFELLTIVFWFNPVIYFYKRAVQEVHELLADNFVVLKHKHKKEYLKLILSKALDATPEAFTNNFLSYDFLKRRAVELTTDSSPKKKQRPIKYILGVLLIACMAVLSGFIQESNFAESGDGKIFNYVDKMPEFPGGQNELFSYLGTNTKYPEEAKRKGITGKVYVNFVVTKNGSIKNAKVLKGGHPLLDRAAVKVVNDMPKWVPGEHKGSRVSVTYNLPFNFKIK